MMYKTLIYGIILWCFKTGIALLPVEDTSVDFQRAKCSQDENGGIDCQPVEKSDTNNEKESVWPPGPYAIPMSIYGCPESSEHGWREGYLTMTWTESVGVFVYNGDTQTNRFNSDWVQHAEKMNNLVWPGHQTYILGPFNEFIFKLNFCFKLRNNPSLDIGVWPTGFYGLYGAKTRCPNGFSETEQSMTTPAIRSWSVDGSYPDVKIQKEETSGLLVMKTCIRKSDDTSENSSSLSILDTPFVFLEKVGTHCQLFENTGHTFVEETIFLGIQSNTSVESTSFCYSGPKSWDTVDDNLEDLYEEQIKKAYYLIPETVVSGDISQSTEVADQTGGSPSDARIFFDKVVMEFQDKRFLPWILIDLGRTISVTALQITSVKDESAELYCFISNEKWAFLYFASVICPKALQYTPYNSRTDILFRRATDGRYIALVRRRTSVDNSTEPITSSTESVRVYTKRLNQSDVSCNNNLGMSDDSIEDNQISVSSQHPQYPSTSIRPYHPGWCASIQDSKPTVTVDLKKTLKVEGLVVWSWSEKLMIQGDSAYVEKQYLLGTRSFKILHGLDADNLHPYNVVFEFDKSRPYDEEQSFLLGSPVNARFIQIHILEPFTDGFHCIKFELIGCISSELFRNPRLYTRHSTITPFQLINQTAVINSIGFPSYIAGRTYSWIIKFQKFVKVVFTHVSLHIYESQDCKDVIRFSRDMLKSTRYSRVIDHRLNENEIQLETEEKQLVITFDSCTPSSRLSVHGSGFQAIIAQQEKQSCFQLESTIDWSEGRSEFCEETTMMLTSMTFLGFPFRKTMEKWTINVPQQQIHLYITEFQVSCKSKESVSEFNVTDAAFEETYCNTKRPPDEISSASDTLIVKFFKDEDPHIMYMEGFRASYSSNAFSLKSEVDYETPHSTVNNVAIGKPSVISSIYLQPARGANDGVIHQDTWLQNCFDTDLEFEPWWLVDLEDIYALDRVVIYNRRDCSECARRSENLEVWVGLNLTSMTMTGFHCGILKASKIFPQMGVKAKYVQVQTRNKKTYMNLCEIEVYGVFDSRTDDRFKTTFKKPESVNGNWGSWGKWSDVCTKKKQQRRKRFCNNPAPNFGGVFCVGNGTSSRTCIPTGVFEENILDNVNMAFSSRDDKDLLCNHTLVQDYPWVLIDLLNTYHLEQLTFSNHKFVKNLIILTGETLCYMKEQYFTKCGGTVTDEIDLTGVTARYIKLQVLEEARSLQLCQLRLSGVKEDEYHLMFECERYTDLRKTYRNSYFWRRPTNFAGQNYSDRECETTFQTFSSVRGEGAPKNEWSPWSTCSAVCGKGTQKRTRVCFNNNTDSKSASCQQTDTEYRTCGNLESCLVCSRKYNKCYNIMHELTNWLRAGYDCWRRHMMLVSINSADELRFVKSLLRNESKYSADHPSRVLPGIDGDVTYFAHIGLYRHQTGQRIQDYTENKKPVVFTAWKPGEPSSGNCTKMNFQFLNQESTWESEDCDTGLAEFYICEMSFENNQTHSTPNARFSKYSDDWHPFPDQQIKTTEYTGTVNITDKNTTCIPWTDATKRKKENVMWWQKYFQSEQETNIESTEENGYRDFPDGSIASALNYCRDPGNEGFLWCFTEDSFETCTVTLPDAPNSSLLYQYRGKQSTTYTGKTCQQWNTSFPHMNTLLENDFQGEPVSEKRNYCRDPWNNGYLWCYTIDINTRWEPCFVKESTSGRCSEIVTKYNGTLNMTVSGMKCEKWNKQLLMNEANGNDVGSVMENYCRDPFNDGFIWCYINIEELKREICILEDVNTFNERTEDTDATFKCSDGNLIKKDNECDRKIDCIDVSDEMNCWETVKNHGLVEDLFLNVTDTELLMEESYFLCDSKEWISLLAKCDGVIDCLDASDEIGCMQKRECLEEDEFRCNTGECIHISQVCDFIEDCTDASDEYCGSDRCENDQYRCNNGQCISAEQRCDAYVNCVDGSDEQSCDTCSKDRAFHCDIFRCIPKRLVCDKYMDCTDRSDETLCVEKTFYSCQDLWGAGYRETGSYVIDGMDVICNFTSVSENGVIYTVFKNMDIVWYNDTRTGNMFIRTNKRESDLNFVEKFATGNCTQEVRQSCIHVQKSIRSYVEQKNSTDYQKCSCAIQRITGISNTANLTCTYNPYNGSGLVFDYELSDYIRSVKLLPTHTKYHQIEVGNIICTTQFKQNKEDVTCKNDVKIIPNELRCVYDTDAGGFIRGCRSMSHLHDCEQFSCPPATVKCPGRYCIPIKYICDGNIECPGGEDEQMCGCSETEKEIAIIVYKDFYSSHSTVVEEFAKQFYNPSSVVRILIYETISPSRTSLSLSTEQLLLKLHLLKVQDIQIEPFDVLHRIEDCEYKVMADNFINSIRFTKPSSKGIIFIDSTNSSKESAAREILTKGRQNISIYRVIERPDVIPVTGVYPNVSDVVVRRWKSLSHIGSEHFSKLCTVASMVHIPNSYKCSSSKVFIPTFQVCDGIAQCIHGDDERLCQFNCPSKCSCKGFVVNCTGANLTMNEITTIPKETRLLDLSMNNLLKDITNDHNLRMTALIRLNLSHCDIENISLVAFMNTKNLLTLNLSYNRIKTLRMSTFEVLNDLTELSLSGNFELVVIEAGAFKGLTKIHELHLAGGKFTKISANTFSGLILDHLDLSGGRLHEIEPLAFNELTVETIDFTKNDVKNFHQDIFKGVMKLKKLRTPAYKFCCVKPNYMNEEDCLPFKDEFSSCEDLMRLPALQTMLWFIGLAAFFGNALSILYRIKFDKERRTMPFGIFVINLAAADFLMSVYLIIIATADAIFRKRYIVVDDAWRNSALCTFAGILSTMSSEASILFICLITLDRLLVAKYPFGEVRFDTARACASALVAWVFSLFIAVLPVAYESYFQNKFYSKSGVCIALPLTRDRPPGWMYSVAIFVGLNFGTFILVAIGQWMIFSEIRKNKYVKVSKDRVKDLKIARNLLFVVATDFLCWFPIGVMGMMALNGHVISGDVYAWSAVFILPVNSALNPILYTVTAIVGKKKFAPSEDEQNRFGGSSIRNSEILCTHGLLLFKVGRYFIYSKNQVGDYISIGSAMDRNISIDPTTILKIGFRIVKCMDVLHGGFMVVQDISRDTVFVDVSNNKVIGNIRICGEPSIQQRPGDSRDDIYKVGILINYMCQKALQK